MPHASGRGACGSYGSYAALLNERGDPDGGVRLDATEWFEMTDLLLVGLAQLGMMGVIGRPAPGRRHAGPTNSPTISAR
jgi:hypothetical protein